MNRRPSPTLHPAATSRPADDPRFALTPKGAAHASARALDAALASVPGSRTALTEEEFAAAVEAALAATLPALRANLRRELAARAASPATDVTDP